MMTNEDEFEKYLNSKNKPHETLNREELLHHHNNVKDKILREAIFMIDQSWCMTTKKEDVIDILKQLSEIKEAKKDGEKQ